MTGVLYMTCTWQVCCICTWQVSVCRYCTLCVISLVKHNKLYDVLFKLSNLNCQNRYTVKHSLSHCVVWVMECGGCGSLNTVSYCVGRPYTGVHNIYTNALTKWHRCLLISFDRRSDFSAPLQIAGAEKNVDEVYDFATFQICKTLSSD